ncbi:drug resistance transporter, EmrB/QacA subfamily [Streptomyces sp. cf386]|uniref:MFS transporter n=1 Tax=Streptomyces sp. cf386 TaxID=1761904 RepID=UPI00088DAAC9|nr:MFS transporter [Streptomyces sp. cf386]SDO80140.1 drug resistance transporter, EmrB/QacA subfamily [Streptomyces sp. cf386]
MRAESSSAARTGAFIAVAVVLFCIQLDFFALNLAVPGIADEFGVTASAAQWTLSAYMLSIGCCFIVGGRVGDVFGRRGALLAGTALFAAGSVGCALAPGLWLLVGARIVQGIGAGFVFPVSVSVISNAFPDTSRARALGAVFGIANVGTALGPFVGGGFTEGPGWRWIFWLLAPLSVLALIVAYVYVPDSRDPTAPRQLDLAGCLTIVCGLAALTLAVERGSAWGWDHARTLILLTIAAVAGALFLRRERRTPHPLVDLRLFRNTPYVLVTGTGTVTNMGYAVTVFVSTLYLQQVRGLSPLDAGLVFLAPAVLVALSGPLGARLSGHMRPTSVMALAGAVAGTGMIALSTVTAWWLYVPVFAWCGLGLGLGWTFASAATQQVVAPERAGEASGVLLTFLVTLGGVALAGAAAAITAMVPERTPEAAYDAILRFGGGVILAASVVVMAVRHRLVVLGRVPPLGSGTPRGGRLP